MTTIRNHRVDRDGVLHGEFVGLDSAHDTDALDSPTHPVVLVRTKSGEVAAWHAETNAEKRLLIREQPRRGHIVDLYRSSSSGDLDMITSAPDVLHGGVDRTHPDVRPHDPDRQRFLEAEVELARSLTPTNRAGQAVGTPSREATDLVAMLKGVRPAAPAPVVKSVMSRRELDAASRSAHSARVENMLTPEAPPAPVQLSAGYAGYVGGVVAGVQEGWNRGAVAGANQVRDQFRALELSRVESARSAAALDLATRMIET